MSIAAITSISYDYRLSWGLVSKKYLDFRKKSAFHLTNSHQCRNNMKSLENGSNRRGIPVNIFSFFRSLLTRRSESTENLVVAEAIRAKSMAKGFTRRVAIKDGKIQCIVEDPSEKINERPGEKTYFISDLPIPVEVLYNNRVYAVSIVTEPNDGLAKILTEKGEITENDIHDLVLSRIAAAVAPLGENLTSALTERVRARLSLSLMDEGFRAEKVEISSPIVSEGVEGTPQRDTETLKTIEDIAQISGLGDEEFAKVREIGKNLWVDTQNAKLKEMLAALEDRMTSWYEETRDTRTLEERLDIDLSESADDKAQSRFNPASLFLRKKPFTAIVLKRADIDTKLRHYIVDSLKDDIEALREYRKLNPRLGLDLQHELQEIVRRVTLARDKCDTAFSLTHSISNLKPSGGKIRECVKIIRRSADAADALRTTIKEIIQTPADDKSIMKLIKEADQGVSILLKCMDDRRKRAY